MRAIIIGAMVFLATVRFAGAAPINTNDITVYNLFATGATVQNFEAIAGVTPLGLSSYANALNSSTAVPTAAQLSLDITGLLFHSGGGSFNNPTGNPGTPTAVLQLQGGIAGNAHSATNVVGGLEINSENLDLDNFIEVVFINTLQSRIGVWLNPGLGNVLFSAFDSTGSLLEATPGTAGNFVGVERGAAEIKFVSIVGVAGGFTVDDLTYAGTPTTTVPEPATLSILGLGLLGLLRRKR